MGKIRYKDLIDRGFKAEYYSDKVHEDNHGYVAFRLDLKLTKRLSLHWHPDDMICKVQNCNKEYDVIYEKELTLEEVGFLINLHSKERVEDKEQNNYNCLA